MPDFDYDGPAQPRTPRPARPHVPPVRVRLEGDRDLDVLAALDVLRAVFAVSGVSRLYVGRDGLIRVYFTISREFPYSGGVK
jgi:hypothetical protein